MREKRTNDADPRSSAIHAATLRRPVKKLASRARATSVVPPRLESQEQSLEVGGLVGVRVRVRLLRDVGREQQEVVDIVDAQHLEGKGVAIGARAREDLSRR